MLVLSRKPGERILIGPNIEVVVVAVRGDRVQLGFECPSSVRILRQELRNQAQPIDRLSVAQSAYRAECA
jgi:carbon storage regulator